MIVVWIPQAEKPRAARAFRKGMERMSARSELPIEFAEGLTVPPGIEPIVVIGANGTGKTTMGVRLVKSGCHRVSARRHLNIPDTIPPQPKLRAQSELDETVRSHSGDRRNMASDMHLLLTSLQAEEIELGRQLRLKVVEEKNYVPSPSDYISRLDAVTRIWESLFPGRNLSFEDNSPKVQASHGGSVRKYAQDEMSDGERQALYLSLKIASIPDESVIAVDEPEIHLHPSLARRIWDRLQEFRPKSRFVYITHDLPFAISRRPSGFVVCRGNGKHEYLTKVPEDVTQEILGGASVLVMAGRVYFCEGQAHSLDVGLFDAWFVESEACISPVGSCDLVVRAVEGYRAVTTTGAVISGIVDRDVRCEAEISYLKEKGLHVLPVAMVEQLYCLPEVVRAVLSHLGVSERMKQDDGLEGIRQQLVKAYSPLIHRFALARAVEHVGWHTKFPLGKVSPGVDSGAASANLETAVSEATKLGDPKQIYQEAESVITRALSGSMEDMLREIPDKQVLSITSKALGVSSEVYATLVRKGLRGDLGLKLKTELIDALAPSLPPRN